MYVDTISVSLTGNASVAARLIDTLKVGPIAEPLALRILGSSRRSRTIVVGDGTTYPDSVFVNLGGGGSAVAPWTATLNGRTTTLAKTAGVGSAWLTWSRSGGSLPLGIHVDTVTVSAAGALGSPARVVDTLVVIREAQPLAISLEPTSRYREAELGSGTPAADSADVRFLGTGAGEATWTATANKAWLQLLEFNGVGEGTVRWVRKPAGLIAGIYVDTIVVVAAGAIGSPTRLIDTLVIKKGVTPPPGPGAITLTVSPRSRFDAATEGATGILSASAAIALTGTGADSVHWTASNRRAWVTVGTTAGVGSGPVTWTRSLTGLVAGTYVDTISVVAPAAAGSPARVIDTLLIGPKPDTTTPGVGEANSPTGRSPRLVWTKKRQWVWNKMRAENHPWWQLIKSNADRSLTGAERYGDSGEWATLAFQMTGDVAYARKALTKLRQSLAASYNGNSVREKIGETPWIYDWIYPALTPAERLEVIDGLNRMAGYVLGTSVVGGLRFNDSDEATAYYFGLAFIDLATGPENPLAGSYLGATFSRTSKLPVGGLDATGVDRTTLRNTVADFVRLAAGGEWIESGMYNSSTTQYLLMGAEGIRTATGVDHFPEITNFSRQAAQAYTYQITSDVKQIIQWGDEEHPRDFEGRLFRHTAILGMLAGLNQDNAEGHAAQGVVADLVNGYGYTGYHSAEPSARILAASSPGKVFTSSVNGWV